MALIPRVYVIQWVVNWNVNDREKRKPIVYNPFVGRNGRLMNTIIMPNIIVGICYAKRPRKWCLRTREHNLMNKSVVTFTCRWLSVVFERLHYTMIRAQTSRVPSNYSCVCLLLHRSLFPRIRPYNWVNDRIEQFLKEQTLERYLLSIREANETPLSVKQEVMITVSNDSQRYAAIDNSWSQSMATKRRKRIVRNQRPALLSEQ